MACVFHACVCGGSSRIETSGKRPRDGICGARGYLTKVSAGSVASTIKVAGRVYASSAMAEQLACNLSGDSDALVCSEIEDPLQ